MLEVGFRVRINRVVPDDDIVIVISGDAIEIILSLLICF